MGKVGEGDSGKAGGGGDGGRRHKDTKLHPSPGHRHLRKIMNMSCQFTEQLMQEDASYAS